MIHSVRNKAKIWFFTLLFLLAFQAIGWILVFQTTHFDARQSAQHNLNEQNTAFETRSIDLKTYASSLVGKKEIRLAGRLFDIKSKAVIGDTVRLVLYHDKKEESLFYRFQELWNGSDADAVPSGPNHVLAKWLSTFFLVPECPMFVDFTTDARALDLPRPAQRESQIARGIVSPPPEQA